MQKFFKNIKVIIILLIICIILFTVLGSFKLLENMDDSIPQCYSSIDEDTSDNNYAGYASYKKEDDDKYILKTKIVPPKGTACPTKISEPASEYLNNVGTVSENIQTSSSSSNISNTSTQIINTTSPEVQNSNLTVPAPANSLSSFPSEINQTQEKTQEKSQNSCPPCPACDRCPEPAFDCKKVPNYRSPSIGQYLPMPVLNDFSTF